VDSGTLAGIAVGAVMFGIVLCLLYLGVKFSVEDARRRGKSPILVSIAIIFFFPWGLVAWLLFRPEPIDRDGSGRFRLDDYRVQ
jgi:Kef-type K+ transport system membrane component KefB